MPAGHSDPKRLIAARVSMLGQVLAWCRRDQSDRLSLREDKSINLAVFGAVIDLASELQPEVAKERGPQQFV